MKLPTVQAKLFGPHWRCNRWRAGGSEEGRHFCVCALPSRHCGSFSSLMVCSCLGIADVTLEVARLFGAKWVGVKIKIKIRFFCFFCIKHNNRHCEPRCKATYWTHPLYVNIGRTSSTKMRPTQKYQKHCIVSFDQQGPPKTAAKRSVVDSVNNDKIHELVLLV